MAGYQKKLLSMHATAYITVQGGGEFFSFIFDNKDGHWDETNIARAYITVQGGDEDVNNDNDYGWVIAEDNIDD